MKVHFLYWRINFTIFWRCKVTYYRKMTGKPVVKTNLVIYIVNGFRY